MADSNNVPRDSFKKTVGKTVFLKSARLRFSGNCLDEARRANPSMGNSDNNVPVIRNAIDRINVTAGELLRFKVPDVSCKFDLKWGF